MRKFSKIFLSLIFLGAFFLAGCQSRALRLDLEPPSQSGPAFALAEKLYAKAADLPAVALRGAATYVSARGSRHYFEFEAYSQKPDIFSFLILGPAGNPAVRFLLVGPKAYVLDYGPKRYLTGSRGDLNFESLPAALSPEELVAILTASLAAAPVKAQGRRYGVGPNPVSEVWAWLGDSPEPARLTIDGGPETLTTPNLKLLKTQTLNGEALEVAYADYLSVNRRDQPRTYSFPSRVLAKIGSGRSLRTLEVKYAEVVLGAVLPQEAFRLEPPLGFVLGDL
ncbi:MAG: hypothetical protein LBI10_13165 [Deltaproteobacteria bacterium]|jgi:hypothetical protein|nr:hypothetical protein [Deltaproteobacteria bacterium]